MVYDPLHWHHPHLRGVSCEEVAPRYANSPELHDATCRWMVLSNVFRCSFDNKLGIFSQIRWNQQTDDVSMFQFLKETTKTVVLCGRCFFPSGALGCQLKQWYLFRIVQVYGPITCQLWDLSRRIIVNLILKYGEVPLRQSVKPGT